MVMPASFHNCSNVSWLRGSVMSRSLMADPHHYAHTGSQSLTGRIEAVGTARKHKWSSAQLEHMRTRYNKFKKSLSKCVNANSF